MSCQCQRRSLSHRDMSVTGDVDLLPDAGVLVKNVPLVVRLSQERKRFFSFLQANCILCPRIKKRW